MRVTSPESIRLVERYAPYALGEMASAATRARAEALFTMVLLSRTLDEVHAEMARCIAGNPAYGLDEIGEHFGVRVETLDPTL